MQKIVGEDSFSKATREKNNLLKEVDEKLIQLKNSAKVTKNNIDFVIYSLYKISIITSYEVFLYENDKPRMKNDEVNNYLYLIDDLFKFQLKDIPHNQIVVSRSEMIENFKVYAEVPTSVLFSLFVKQHYTLLMVIDYFEKDARRDFLKINLLFKFAQVCRNYCDIKSYMRPNNSAEVDSGLIESLIKKSYQVHQWAVKESFNRWSLEQNMFWGAKCLQFWSSSLELYKFFNTQENISKIQSKIAVIEKRILTETKGSSKDIKEEMTLEELLLYKNDTTHDFNL